MPHVIIKLYPGSSEEQKEEMVKEVSLALQKSLGKSERSISVAVEEIGPDDWPEQVYRPDIIEKVDRLYKRPGYVPEGMVLPGEGE